jgi:hypothetical protein
MAFQAGSRVDPRLLDYSGYAQGMTQAAAINAQALASLGQAVGEGITKYNEKQIQKQQKKEATPVIASFLRQIDPTLSEEQSNAGATSFINSVGIEGLQAAIPVLALEGMKSQSKIRLAQIEAFGEIAEQETLSIADQQKVAEGFQEGGVYSKQGFKIVGGQVVQEVNTKPGFNLGDLNPFTTDVEQIPVTSGPVYDAARRAGLLAQTPEIDTSMITGSAPATPTPTADSLSSLSGTTTTSQRPFGSVNAGNLFKPEQDLMNFDSLGLGLTQSDMVVPTSSQTTQKVDTTIERPENYEFFDYVDYGEFESDITSPMTKKQEGFPDIKASNRPLTYSEFTQAQIQRGKDQPRSRVAYVDKESVTDEAMAKNEYEKYLRKFKYDYPDTFEEYRDFGKTRQRKFEEDPQAFREDYLNYLESYQAPLRVQRSL